MKEGIILDVYKDYVVVLTKDGEYLKLRKKSEVSLGDIYKGKPYYKIPYFHAAAAVILIVISTYTGITAYANQIVGYVDITGEKNVRLYVNRKGTVQDVDGLSNPDSLKKLTVEKAAEEISKIGVKEGIFSNSSNVKVTTTELKDSKVNLNKEKDKAEKKILKDKKKDEFNNPKKTNDMNNGQSGKDKSNNKNSDTDNTNNSKNESLDNRKQTAAGNGNIPNNNNNNNNNSNNNGKSNRQWGNFTENIKKFMSSIKREQPFKGTNSGNNGNNNRFNNKNKSK